jgi:putative ABC transport system permease protein
MRFLLETTRLGLANLMLHKLRSLLTSLGIIISVAAVIAVVAIGEGNKRKALADIEKLGARNIIIRSSKPEESQNRGETAQRRRSVSYGITWADSRKLEELRTRLSAIARIVPLKKVATKVSVRDKQAPAAVFGTEPELLDVTSLRIERGRYLTQTDEQRGERIAVIGAEIARLLFPLQDPLDSYINLHNGPASSPFRVVGVLKPVGLAGGAGTALVGRDLNFDVHIPKSAAIDQFSDRIVTIKPGSFESTVVELEEVYVEARNQESVRPVADQVQRLLEVDHAVKGDVTVIVPLELIEQAERTAWMFNIMIIAIASISLFVGGIGIMNIMLASVTERTREIGIRRALGATRKHIASQFLVETTTLSGVGGLIGVTTGVLIAAVLGLFSERFQWGRPMVPAWSIGAGLAVAMCVGILFGLYPAIRASNQDPIVALRHD